MKILFAAPITYDRITLFISDYFSGLARASIRAGHDVRVVKTTENMYNPFIPRKLTNAYTAFRNRFKAVVDFPHDILLGTQLLREVEYFKPDLVIMHFIDTTYLDFFVKKIRQNGTKVLFWLGVHPDYVSEGIRRVLQEVGTVLYYDPEYTSFFKNELGINHISRLPLACEIEKFDRIHVDSHNSMKDRVDICFVGFIDKYREEILHALTEFKLGIWSWNFNGLDSNLKPFYKGAASGDAMIEIFKSSKIVVNAHRLFEKSGGNYRLFEICGASAFQLVDCRPGLAEYFVDGKEIVTFSSLDDLRQKVIYYLENDIERQRIAIAGYQRVCRDHTFANRMKKIIDIAREH
ncbi:glycosyltransferase [uncultured Desulfuromonas sp.]|uniref:CgeB family protein n=1 Tax=uncultured Desulfuromonas sp. TaxID=181013 RepID=UPI002AAB1889|nr:glycosyltransferase [uncultured Desulfuromonas sp.]